MIKQMYKRIQLIRNSQRSQRGFTLIEILISLIIASIIVSTLLYLVVELLRVDQRETVLDRTQRDMQRALDYVADDLREAVYVYSTPTTLVTNLGSTGNALPISAQPVLAFWKIRPLDDDLTDSTNYYQSLSTPGTAACNGLTGDNLTNCRALLIRHGYYELVIYYTTTENVGSTWEGDARLYRYALPEYSTTGILAGNLTPNPEFNDNVPSGNFGNWVPVTGTVATERGEVLVDYVAALSQSDFDPTCDAGYQSSPGTVDTSDSFYACIRPITNTANAQFLNQDVVLFLMGDAKNNPVASVGVSDRSELPRLQTRVLVRGVLDKELVE